MSTFSIAIGHSSQCALKFLFYLFGRNPLWSFALALFLHNEIRRIQVGFSLSFNLPSSEDLVLNRDSFSYRQPVWFSREEIAVRKHNYYSFSSSFLPTEAELMKSLTVAASLTTSSSALDCRRVLETTKESFSSQNAGWCLAEWAASGSRLPRPLKPLWRGWNSFWGTFLVRRPHFLTQTVDTSARACSEEIWATLTGLECPKFVRRCPPAWLRLSRGWASSVRSHPTLTVSESGRWSWACLLRAASLPPPSRVPGLCRDATLNSSVTSSALTTTTKDCLNWNELFWFWLRDKKDLEF